LNEGVLLRKKKPQKSSYFEEKKKLEVVPYLNPEFLAGRQN
jgi:hypothetical protein